jgi:hypothetical protein
MRYIKTMFHTKLASILKSITPATKFGGCHTLTPLHMGLLEKHTTRHVQSAAPATQQEHGQCPNAAPSTKIFEAFCENLPKSLRL